MSKFIVVRVQSELVFLSHSLEAAKRLLNKSQEDGSKGLLLPFCESSLDIIGLYFKPPTVTTLHLNSNEL